MKLYHLLSKISILRSFSVKLLLITFVGIHIPLVGLAILLSSETSFDISIREVFVLAFSLTFLSASFTLLAINQMLIPVRKAKGALALYLKEKELPRLPTGYDDEVGVLMRSVQQTIENLDELLNEKQDLIALLSHDLRSPVNTSTSLAELIKMENDKAAINAYCDNIIEQNQKQLNLVSTVLNLLQEDHSKLKQQEKIFFSVQQLVDEVLQNFALDIRQKEIKVHTEISKELRICVQPVFQQVLTNIIHNAIKFSRRQQTIMIRAEKKAGNIQIEVEDQGIGFADSQNMQKIFDRFTTLKRKGTEGEPTIGVGMYLSRKIVRQHYGNIEVSSPGKDKGATFRIILPV